MCNILWKVQRIKMWNGVCCGLNEKWCTGSVTPSSQLLLLFSRNWGGTALLEEVHSWRWALNVNSITPWLVCSLCFLLVVQSVISFSVSSCLLPYEAHYYGLFPIGIISPSKLLLIYVVLLVIFYHSSRHVTNTEYISNINKAGLLPFHGGIVLLAIIECHM